MDFDKVENSILDPGLDSEEHNFVSNLFSWFCNITPWET